jgi:hypothetical protein
LDGAKELLSETELVVLEVSFFEFFKGIPQFYDVVRYMKERGFVVYDVVDRQLRDLDGALAQADVAFAKEDGMFRRFTTPGAQGSPVDRKSRSDTSDRGRCVKRPWRLRGRT